MTSYENINNIMRRQTIQCRRCRIVDALHASAEPGGTFVPDLSIKSEQYFFEVGVHYSKLEGVSRSETMLE